MALALITTMYGAIMANLILIPMKSKLEDRDKEETRAKEIIIEGILSIQSGDNPRILLEKLVSFLPPRQREAMRNESVRE
jgi:chemotaxis protein MotA